MTTPQIEVVFRRATLTLSGVIQEAPGYDPYFELEVVRCGDEDLTDIIDPGSDTWVELENLANRKHHETD